MKKILISALALLAATAQAQETYVNADMATEDLNGTARYVGMGGAMEALGADISTIGTNPAGVGLFRRSQVTVSGGFVSQPNAPASKWGDGSTPSFDQLGIVWSTYMGGGKYLNYGFSYHKSRNFNHILEAGGRFDVNSASGSSQNLNSYMNLMDAEDLDDLCLSQLDVLYYKTFVGDKDGNLYFNAASDYLNYRASSGYAAQYDINVSGNVTSRWYLGLTLGVSDIHYKAWSDYSENLLNSKNNPIGSLTVHDYREVSGSGFNFKLGTILFPIEDNPLRIGLSMETPTWYDLSTTNRTELENKANTGGTPHQPNYVASDTYEFKMFTPWKFGVSVGTTIANYVAIGASYQYADYSNIKSRVIDGYDYYGESYSSNDVNMNMHTSQTLKGVSTFKVGLEAKPAPEFALRLGYNYVSSMYSEAGYRDGTLWSPGTYYSSTSDFTNWKATNRFTCGLGYSKNSFAIDLAYQYSATKGHFRPFAESWAEYKFDDGEVIAVENYVNPVEVKKSRHQFLTTLTFKF